MYRGSADIAYVLTKIKETISQLSSFVSEITTARGEKENLNARLDDIEVQLDTATCNIWGEM